MMEFVSVIALILGLLIGYIIVRRVAKPHSKRMGRNGAQPSVSTPTSVGAPAPGVAAPAVAATPKGRFAWVGKYLWTMLLVIAGLVIFFQGVYSSEWQSPSFARVASWSWAHWLQLLVLCGIGAALLKLHKKELGAAEPVLQLTLIAVAVIAFLVCPVIGWFEGIRTSQPATSASYKQPDKAMMLTIQPGGKSERIPVPYQMHVDMNGKDFRFNCVYADGHEESFVPGERSCSNGDMPFVYATNTRTDGPNVITYSYEK